MKGLKKLALAPVMAATVCVGAMLAPTEVYASEHGMKGHPERHAQHQKVMAMLARENIEYLRRHYARATDLIGLNTDESIAEGRAVYHKIFTPDAKITTSENGKIGFSAVGPDAWVDVVAGALKVFDSTQHLIGTQLVEIKSLPDHDGNGGEATMSSYLQAWHSDPDRVLDIFIGTYNDKVRYTPGIGWQIYEMNLEKVSGEVTDKSGS